MANCLSKCRHYQANNREYLCKLLNISVVRYLALHAMPRGCMYEPKKTVEPVALGKIGEERARWFFKEIGAEDVHKLEVKKVLVNSKLIHAKGTPCDFICSVPFKKSNTIYKWLSSYIEVKLHDGDKLNHSVLSDEQVDSLCSWNSKGFYSFILWVHKQDCFMIRYPSDHFHYGKALTIKTAEKIAWKKN